ncbi:hypothetical protein V6N13_058983 [Hibiscus sabdariffa]
MLGLKVGLINQLLLNPYQKLLIKSWVYQRWPKALTNIGPLPSGGQSNMLLDQPDVDQLNTQLDETNIDQPDVQPGQPNVQLIFSQHQSSPMFSRGSSPCVEVNNSRSCGVSNFRNQNGQESFDASSSSPIVHATFAIIQTQKQTQV